MQTTHKYSIQSPRPILYLKRIENSTDQDQITDVELIEWLQHTVYDGEYNSNTHKIELKNKEGEILSEINASGLAEDGVLSNAYVDTNDLVLEFNSGSGKSAIRIPKSQLTIDALPQGIDDEPTAGSDNLVKSGGVYADTHLCNVPKVNDFVVDIVLKEGVDDPESENYLDIASATKILVQCCLNTSLNKYQHSLQFYVDGEWKAIFYKSYTTLDEAKADLGKLIEGSRCYCVLCDIGSYNRTINTSLTFNRDVTWKSLNEHPIIKELLIEQGVEEEMATIETKVDYSFDKIFGYDEKNIDEPLTVGKYWSYTAHKWNNTSDFVSNDVTSCKEGDVFIITGHGGAGLSRLYVFTDSDGNNIDGAVAEANEVRENYSLVAPEGAARFYFSARTMYPYKLQKQGSYEGILNELAGIHNDIGNLSTSTAHGEAAYNELFGEEQNPDAIELESGYWYVKNTPPTKVGITGWRCNPDDSVSCETGDTFILTGEGGIDRESGPNTYLWAFADNNGVITRHAEVKEKRVTPLEVTAQEGEVRFYMSSNSGAKPTLFKRHVTKGLAERVEDLDGAVSDMQEEIDNSFHSVSKMFNVPVDLKKPNLKVLDLGNSYTGDATHYLAELVSAANITTGFSVYRTMRGGASFRDYVNMYKETDDATYSVYKVVGDTISGITGSYTGLDNTWFVNLLKQDWDIIIIHQQSVHSTNYDGWTGDGAAGGLTEYLRILRTYCPQATIGFYIVHSYPSWRSSGYQTGADSTERWQNIAKSVEHLKADYGIDFIIPYGTAVQNLRMTSLNGIDPVDNTKKNDFSADGTHLTSGIGDYVAACAYFEALFAPRYDVTVLGNSYTNENVPIPQEGDDDYYQGRGIPVQITAANALLAQRAAILAVNDMFHLNNPETEGFIPANTDTKPVYSGNGSFNDVSWSEIKNKPSLFSGDYNDLSNKPTNISSFTNNSKYIQDEGDQYESIIKGYGEEATIIASNVGHDYGAISVNPGGVDIISNWNGGNAGNANGTHNINLKTSKGKAYYNNREIQTIIDSSNKLNADLVDDTNSTNKFVTALQKQNWNDKVELLNSTSVVRHLPVFGDTSGNIQDSGLGIAIADFSVSDLIDNTLSAATITKLTTLRGIINSAQYYLFIPCNTQTGYVAATIYKSGSSLEFRFVYDHTEVTVTGDPYNNYTVTVTPFLTQHQDISNKEDVTTIEEPVDQTDATQPITTLSCEVGKYYRIDVPVETLAITLPAMTDLTTVKTVVVYLTAGTTPAVTITGTAPTGGNVPDVYYQDGYAIESGKTYEVNCLWNGDAWIVASVEIVLT